MASFNTYSDISAFVNTVYDDAMLVARDNNLMANLVTVYNDRQGMALRKNSEYGTATIQSIGETDDLTSQAFTPAVLSTLTPAEVGAQFFMTDQRLESDPFQVRQDAASELGLAMAQKIEKDLLGNFSSLTGGTVGTAGSAIAWSYFYAMLTKIRAQNAPAPYAFVCRPEQWHYLGKAVAPGATVTNSPALQDSIVGRFYVGSVSGVDIFVSSNISVDSSDDAYCAMFNPMALALDVRRPARLEPERDASRRGWELNLSAVYAHGVWRPKFGVKGIFDSASPDGTS